MDKKFLIICLFIFTMAIGAIIFYSTVQNKAFEEDTISSSNHISKKQFKPKSASIPGNYCQDLVLNGIYEYNITQFGDPSTWYTFDWVPYPWKSDPGGKIKINLTEFDTRHPNDEGDVFPEIIPYFNVEIYNSTEPTPILSLLNVSNSEAAFSLSIGYNYFSSGFLIPIENLTKTKALALEQATGWSNGIVIVEETQNFIYFSFEAEEGIFKEYLLYDRFTGLLVWADITLVGYNTYKLEINSLNFTFNQEQTFNYTVKEFGDPIEWLNFSDTYPSNFEGYANTNISGMILVNLTGYYDKQLNDESVFDNPIPWINITFLENNSGFFFTNFTLYNISNSEAALNLHIGFHNFSSGFFIPVENLTNIKQKAKAEYSRRNSTGILKIEETNMTIKFIFIEPDNESFITATYEKKTGLLLWTQSHYGNFSIEMGLILDYQTSVTINFPGPLVRTKFTKEEEEEKEYANYIIPFIVLGSGAGISIGLLIWKKDVKLLKFLFIGIFGTFCFSSLILFNSWFYSSEILTDTSRTEEKLEEVYDITLIIDYGDGTIKQVAGFFLTGGETTVLDALEDHCSVDYVDYGWGIFVTHIDGVKGDWVYEVNGERADHGSERYYLRDGDVIEWINIE